MEKWQKKYLLEEALHSDTHDRFIIEGVLGLIHIGRQAYMNNDELYLTECVRCCSDGASYRLFSDKPTTFSGLNSTSGMHITSKDGLIAKCYGEDEGLAGYIAAAIAEQPKKLGETEDIPEKSIVYKLK